jgi:hypothetical protein
LPMKFKTKRSYETPSTLCNDVGCNLYFHQIDRIERVVMSMENCYACLLTMFKKGIA